MNTTHIGSLPYLTILEAIEFNKKFSLPCLPTLPKLNEDEWMINQFLCGFMVRDHKLPFCCFDEFFEEFKGRVKVQVCGIQTLFNNLSTVVDKYDFIDWYRGVVERFVNSIKNDFVLFFDEPDLRDVDFELWSVYSHFNQYELGIHCCGKGKWRCIDLELFNHISFDSSLISKEDVIFLRISSKILYLGDIDSSTGEYIINSRIVPNKEDFVTPSCGLALTSLSALNKMFQKIPT